MVPSAAIRPKALTAKTLHEMLLNSWRISQRAHVQSAEGATMTVQRCGLQLLGDALVSNSGTSRVAIGTCYWETAEFVLLQFLDAEILQDRFQAPDGQACRRGLLML